MPTSTGPRAPGRQRRRGLVEPVRRHRGDRTAHHPLVDRTSAAELEHRTSAAARARRRRARRRRTSSSCVAEPDASASDDRRAADRPGRPARRGVASMPSASSTSAAHVAGVAPRRRSAFVPALSALVISPGTASTSRPSSSAKSAVISAPDRSRASTTTVARASPAMIRFRAGKRQGAGSTPGSYSETTRPPSRRSNGRARHARPGSRGRCRSRGRRRCGPPAASAPRCASPSIPRASPLTTTAPGRRRLGRQRPGDGPAVAGARPCADDRDRRIAEHVDVGISADPERRRRIGDLARAAADSHARRVGAGEWSRERQLRRRAVRERLRDVLRQDVRGAGEGRDRARDAGDAGAPRPLSGSRSTARSRSSEEAVVRRGAARASRSAAAVDAVPHGRRRLAGPAASSSARGRGIATTRSNRSRSARETLSRYAVTRADVHEQSSRGSPRPPQGHRFIVATSRNRAGNSARPPTRATDTTPSSSGCRSASSTERGNSGSSSSSRTPRCARLTSPGRGTAPPPTTAAADAPWCGARNGGVATSPPRGAFPPPSGSA